MTITHFGGEWTAQKLEILKQYLDSYTTALKDQPFSLIYIDAFAGSGFWRPRSSYGTEDYDDYRELLKGSAALAIDVSNRPFDRLVFIEKDPERSQSLTELRVANEHRDISIINEDANQALPKLCSEMRARDRAVVFLDPFATEVSWDIVEAIARTQKIDCWILFPLMAVTRMSPTESEPSESEAVQLDRVFGGREHWQGVYSPSPQLPLFGGERPLQRESGSSQFAENYRVRLESAFESVAPTRRTFLNSMNTPIFELFFAASNRRGAPIAVRIADHILRNW